MKALLDINVARSLKEVAFWEKIAKKRAGARGAEARKRLLESEAKSDDLKKR